MEPHCCDPFRRPYWRWQRAQHLFQGHVRPHRLDDAIVRRVVQYLQAMNCAGTAQARARVEAREAALTAARRIFELDDSTSWMLKAWLLTNESADRIAARLGLDLATVRLFELVFHNVREDDRPTGFDWIIMNVIGGDCWDRKAPPPVVVWMCTALWAGPHALDLIIEAYEGERDASTLDLPVLAAQARWMVEWCFADWGNARFSRQLLTETRRLFQIGLLEKEPEGPRRLLALMMKSIELEYAVNAEESISATGDVGDARQVGGHGQQPAPGPQIAL
jgi:hypothetical protein